MLAAVPDVPGFMNFYVNFACFLVFAGIVAQIVGFGGGGMGGRPARRTLPRLLEAGAEAL